MTCAIVVGLTIYAFYTKTDFTYCGGLFFMLLLGSMAFGILNIFIQNRVMEIALGLFGAILGGLYLIYDTQLIVGDKARALSVDDYIIGALSLYIDIIKIFVEILRVLNEVNR